MLRDIQHHRFAILVLLVAVLISTSCASGTPAGSSPTEPPKATQTPQPTATTAPTNTPIPTATETPGPEAAAPELSSISSNVSQLNSYRMSMEFKVTGTDADDKATDQTMTFSQEVAKATNSVHFAISGFEGIFGTGTAGTGSMEMYQLDKNTYLITTMGSQTTPTCMSFSGEEANFDKTAIDPGEMLNNITPGALIARGELVNGVKTDHYKVEKAGVSFGNVTSESGEVWIAQDGGFAVRFVGQAEGLFDLSTSIKGQMTWTYDLKDVNQTFTIELPALCSDQQNALSDLPIPDNATKVSTLGKIITFGSPDKPDVVAKYFRDNLPGKGWKITEDTAMGDALFMLTAEKEDQTLSFMIAADDQTKGTSVIITAK